MDILLVSSIHPPFDPRIYHKIFCSLKASGFQVKILLPNQLPLAKNNDDFISFNGFSGKWSRFLNNIYLAKVCLSLKPKLIIFFDPDLLPFMELLKFLFKSVIVFDNHEDYPSYIMVKQSVPVWARSVIKDIFLLFFYLGKHILDFIIYSDQFTTGINIEKQNEIIIYNYPILSNFTVLEKEYDVIYPGSLDLGICQRILNIAEELDKSGDRKIKFLIIGRDVSKANCSLIEEFKNRMKNTELLFMEDLSHDDVQIYIAKSKIGIIPMPNIDKFNRNIPTKLFEYLMHKIPILGSDFPAISFFLNDTEGNFLIKEENYYSSYREKILEILNNYSYFSETAKRNFALIEDRWNWNISEKPKLIHLVSILLEKK